ncbi:MAG: LysE family translocator [Ramlibacter sp.]|jgi:threonine/homoserine/homoserine lactone efflux protein|nr:LysE family translocator [Ramlibacter sp.]
MAPDQLLLFIVAGLLLNLTPGPDVLYIVGNALKSGARAGIVAAFGITAGCFVHIFAAAVGVSALLAASATAFTLLKWVGAAYLVWVGIRMLRSSAPAPVELAAAAPGGAHSPELRAIFFRGFATNALNPKVALFFLAFLPQFIGPAIEHKSLAFLLLGLLFNFNGLFVNIGWGLAAAWLSARVGAVRKGMHWLERAAGAMFLGFGLKLALSDNPSP